VGAFCPQAYISGGIVPKGHYVRPGGGRYVVDSVDTLGARVTTSLRGRWRDVHTRPMIGHRVTSFRLPFRRGKIR